MARSGSANGDAPRTALLIPLVTSFLMLQPEAWGWDFCDPTGDGCSAIRNILSWSFMVFPHPFTFVFVMTSLGAGGSVTMLALMDFALAGLIWRTQPPRLSRMRLTMLLVGWAALSAGSAFATPYMMVGFWKAFH